MPGANRRQQRAKSPIVRRGLAPPSASGYRGAILAYTWIMTSSTSTTRTSPRSRSTARIAATLDHYAQRGRECAYGNVRMIARSVRCLSEDTLRPVDFLAGQLSLLLSILASEPSD